ncbi:sulfurtransferase complex subunit TusB [Pseudomonas stutzeri]|nr:sulfurtransferase complex subunit TusB [Stutzerimonas stutzeri]
MATLHLLSRSPFADTSGASCLRLLGAGDGLLLCGDAVYALQPGSAPCAMLRALPADRPLFALAEDLEARGIAAPDFIQALDYPGFVELTLRFERVNSWL